LSRIRVERANEGDIPVLLILAEKFMPRECTREKRVEALRRALKNEDYMLLVAQRDGEIVGFIDQWIIHDFAHGAKLSYIQNLYVAYKDRRSGIGTRLLQEILKGAETEGVMEIHAATEFGDDSAIRLYKKHGLVKESLQLEREFGKRPL
jgi:ribosomal protein S18 acetylase RimI-like enzyme